jgi:hypothetical protein
MTKLSIPYIVRCAIIVRGLRPVDKRYIAEERPIQKTIGTPKNIRPSNEITKIKEFISPSLSKSRFSEYYAMSAKSYPPRQWAGSGKYNSLGLAK